MIPLVVEGKTNLLSSSFLCYLLNARGGVHFLPSGPIQVLLVGLEPKGKKGHCPQAFPHLLYPRSIELADEVGPQEKGFPPSWGCIR